MALIASLVINFQAQTADALKKFGGLKSGLKSIGAVATSTQGAFTALLGAIGAGVAVAKVTDLTKASFELADELGALAERTSFSEQSLNRLRYAAVKNDIEFNTLAMSLKKLQVNLADAAVKGSGETKDALDMLGLSANELIELEPEEAFFRLATALSKVKNPATAAFLAFKTLGKSGVELLPFLQLGEEGIKKYADELKRLGGDMSNIEFDTLNKANEAFDDLRQSLTSIGNSIAVAIAPSVTDLAKRFSDAGFGGQSMAEKIDQGIKDQLSVLDVFVSVGKAIKFTFDIIQLGYNGITEFLSGALGQLMKVAMRVQTLLGFNNGSEENFMSAYSENLAAWRKDKISQMKQPSGGTLSDWYKNVDRSSSPDEPKVPNTVIDSYDELTESIENAEKAKADLAKSSRDLISGLEQEIATFGMSSRAAKIYQMSITGASDLDISQATILKEKLENLEANEKHYEDLASKAAALKEEITSPLQAFENKIKEIDQLLLSESITFEEAQAAKLKAAGDVLAGAGDDEGSSKAIKFAAGGQYGSRQAHDSILAAQGQATKDPVKEGYKYTKMMIEEQRKANQHLAVLAAERVADEIGGF